jgi:hypothetical protein
VASYPTLSDGRSDIIASSSAVLQLSGILSMPLTASTAAAPPAPAADNAVLTAAAPAPDNVPELAGQPVSTFLTGSSQELRSAAAGQVGSRKLKVLGRRRQLLQTCPPANPCLVSVCVNSWSCGMVQKPKGPARIIQNVQAGCVCLAVQTVLPERTAQNLCCWSANQQLRSAIHSRCQTASRRDLY